MQPPEAVAKRLKGDVLLVEIFAEQEKEVNKK